MQNMHQIAILFLDRQIEEPVAYCRSKLINRCISHLVDSADISLGTAEDIALQALAEIEARNTDFAVDLVRTTAHAVFIVDPRTGNQRCFTIGELLELC
jgi:hypothetical protein